MDTGNDKRPSGAEREGPHAGVTNDEPKAAPDRDRAGEPERLTIALAWVNAIAARNRVFGDGISMDAAWNILLDLFIQRCRNRRVAIGDACLAAGVPESTALRWIKLLQARGDIERTSDASDRRRSYIALSEQGLTKIAEALDASAASDRHLGLGRLRDIKSINTEL